MARAGRHAFVSVVAICIIAAAGTAAGQETRPMAVQPRIQRVESRAVSGQKQDRTVVTIPLNQVGVFDTAFLNRRNPPQIPRTAILAFDNRTANRTITVTFDANGTKKTDLDDILKGFDGYTTCKKETCTVKVKIPRRRIAQVPVNAFKESDEVNSFTVSFVEEDEDPAQSRGFFYSVKKDEPDDETAWSVVASVGGALEPDTGGDDATFSGASPWGGGIDRHFTGSGELRLKRTLGSRADADVTAGFKDGDLGASDQSLKLQVNKYRVNIYGMNGVVLSLGKFTFAAPTSGLAIKEKGEGFRLAWGPLAVSHLINRESQAGKADDDNRDNRELVLEANNLSGTKWGVVKSVNAIAVYGHERLTADKTDTSPAVNAHSYFTIGGEVFVAPAIKELSASVAAYASRARAIGGSQFPRSTGVSTFGTASWTFYATQTNADDKLPVNGTLTFQVGHSTSSREDDGAARTHAYVGEHTAFEPDLLFVSGFAGKLDAATGIGVGLANKTYASLSYTDERYSPLASIARAIGVPKGDIASRSSAVTWHHYRIGRGADGSRPSGDEFNLLFQVETPANIESLVQVGYFRPHGSLAPIFSNNPWSIVAKVKVTL